MKKVPSAGNVLLHMRRQSMDSVLDDSGKRQVDFFFELLVSTAALGIALACIFSQPLCLMFVDEQKGCGVSLDDALNYTLAHPAFNSETSKAEWANPGYIADTERLRRRWFLLGMNLIEADFGRRMTIAIISGGIIGFERRAADRPAGIRTMSLASLGACLFTICGTFAFLSGPQSWDASRISAAIPGGTGFLGAGIIWKGTAPGETNHKVRGLTTAASVWISAAAGTAAGGGLYFSAIYGALMSVVILRYGPRLYGHPDSMDDDDDDDDDENDDDDDVGDEVDEEVQELSELFHGDQQGPFRASKGYDRAGSNGEVPMTALGRGDSQSRPDERTRLLRGNSTYGTSTLLRSRSSFRKKTSKGGAVLDPKL